MSEVPAGVGEDTPPTALEPRRQRRLRHDVRQSLCAVMALVDILDQSNRLPAQALETVDQIRREADWMAELLSSVDAGHSDRCVVDVGEAAADTWARVAAYAPCSVRLVRESGTFALVDPVELHRSVRNLLDNAVRAAGPDGCVEVKVVLRGAEVVLAVTDSGPGFGALAAQERLGLQTVGAFLANSGGLLAIGTSDLGGASVGLRLPLADPEVGVRGGTPI